MEVKHVLHSMLVYALLMICVADTEKDNGYIFTSPRTLKVGSNNQLQFFRSGCLDEGFLKVRLFYYHSYDRKNETLLKEQDYQLEKGKKDSFFTFFVNAFGNDFIYDGRLQINGTICEIPFSGSDKVIFSIPNENITLIQTDKPLYKPGQMVKFRVLKFDQNLRPSNKNNDTADVFVEDPKGARLFQFKEIDLGKGIQQMQFPLADETALGSWSITVSKGTDSSTITFDVKKYKLPKFDISINFPSFVLINTDSIPVQVCAKYTYGKVVQGTLNLNTSVQIFNYQYSGDRTPIIQNSVKIDGCYNYTINYSSIDPLNQFRYRRIMVAASVIEDGTGVERHETQYLSRDYSPLKLNFNSDADQRQYYKPGLPYTGKLKVTNPDDSPAEGEPIEICATVSREREIADWFAKKKIKFCRNYTSDDNGFIKYALQPQNIDSISINLEIITQGKIVSTGTKKVSFHIEDDVSGKFDNDNELINESQTQLLPAPKSSSSSSSSDSSSDEQNCPGARDARYTPPIGEVHIPIDVDTSLSPSFTLLVFYVRDDKETVADAQKIEVEKCFKNKVYFEFGDEEKQPGTQTTIRVMSSPNSLCGLKIVDKSISILDSSEQLTKDKIFQFIEDSNTDSYYNSDPCNDDIPQPGLQSSKLNFWKWDAGYLVISNLILFSRPCSGNGAGDFDESDYVTGEYLTAEYETGEYDTYESDSISAQPAAPAAFIAKPNAAAATTSVKNVRDYFPETWLFQMEMTGPSGIFESQETLPDTITEWEGSAVCISPKDGLGLSGTASIKGFQAFFISYNLPISVIRGEEFVVVASIFSYVDAALPVTVSLDQPQGFVVANDSTSGDLCVQPNTSNSIRLTLKGTTVGKVNITVKAETASSSKVCGNSPTYDAPARDAITQSFEVEAEGFPNENVHSILFCPSDEKNQMFSQSYVLSLPEDVVPESARAFVDITGNILGPAIQNLDSLVSLPTGCGEQNMVKFTPNYLVLDYLNDIGKLDDDIKSRAIQNLYTGYQRELNFRHYDGSFSAFGQSDKTGSMFLTAFVLRSFYEAQRYINIDEDILTDMQRWIISKQKRNGCFPNIGQIIDTGIQGSLEGEQNAGAITAYVVASLLISKYENQTIISKAMSCLNKNPALNPYETFLYAYSEALAGEKDAVQESIDEIKPRANTTEGIEFYRNPNGTQATDIETAAYAVLANLQVGNSASDVLPLVRYLSMNLNPQGGFYSTQDTCVGLHALSNFAKIVFKDPINIQVSLSGGLQETVQITEDNKLLVQRNMVSQVPSQLKIQASGTGCGLFQTYLRYNTNTPPEKKKFYLEVLGGCTSPDCKKGKITTDVSYLPQGKAAGMSIVEIKMITGVVPVRESLDKLTSNRRNKILKVDVEDNKVICYFDEISNNDNQFSFDVERVIEVKNPQPGSAKVFDYYAPENSATTSYSFQNSTSKQPSTSEKDDEL
ncbi:alpha-1-inhibitor 3 [Nephila pilipes]|uniref:TEP1-F n=1 Tax=Nephila pilipes TaxID=299642 RepID=A0A8X6N2K4_NEPPI|nr:alpha-1-inhibitor 3 [Nephila pilipes]